jgi:hypothetical protein
MAGAYVGKTTDFNPPSDHRSSVKSPSVATAAEAMENYKGNTAGVWHNDDADPDNPTGKYAFQRLRHTWFTPKLIPSSHFAGTINSMLSVHVLRAVSNTP